MLTKNDCYKLLIELKNKGVNVDKQFLQLSQQVLPSKDIIKFINSHRSLEIIKFYDNLRKENNKKKSKLYINIMKEINSVEAMITLSSLLTKMLIFSKELGLIDRINFFKAIDYVSIQNALTKYFTESDFSYGIEVLSKIKSDIKVYEELKD